MRALGLPLILAIGAVIGFAQPPASQPSTPVPGFVADSAWPKLPNSWVLGVTSSVAVDQRDHVFILHRPRTVAAGQKAAPPVVEFDADGKFIRGWGGPSNMFEWPDSEHGIYVDNTNGIWIGGSSRPGAGVCGEAGPCTREDAMLLKFTATGEFLLQIGHRDKGTGPTDTKNVHAATGVIVHNGELFVSDGYRGPGQQGNCRVIVFDANTGAFKRMWGGFGDSPTCDPADAEAAPAGRGAGGGRGGRAAQPALDTEGPGPRTLSTVHGINVSKDGLVYVCDRGHRRIQIFTVDGKYVDQVFINRSGPSNASAAGLSFSPDPEQKYMYVADYGNSHVVVVDRKSLRVLSQFGERGANPGDFQGLHNIAIDSKGNLYTAEVEPGRRAQRFVYRGMAPLNARNN